MRWYIDSSAIIKLIKLELESKALVDALPKTILSSTLARVEVIRSVTFHISELLEEALAVLAEIEMIPIDNAVITIAENLPPFMSLRTLDSIHIASALTVKSSIEGLITYDKEMIEAAEALGFKVLSPGMK